MSDVLVIGNQSFQDAEKYFNEMIQSTNDEYTLIVLYYWEFSRKRQLENSSGVEVETFLSFRKKVTLIELCEYISSKYLDTSLIGVENEKDALSILLHHHKEGV